MSISPTGADVYLSCVNCVKRCDMAKAYGNLVYFYHCISIGSEALIDFEGFEFAFATHYLQSVRRTFGTITGLSLLSLITPHHLHLLADRQFKFTSLSIQG